MLPGGDLVVEFPGPHLQDGLGEVAGEQFVVEPFSLRSLLVDDLTPRIDIDVDTVHLHASNRWNHPHLQHRHATLARRPERTGLPGADRIEQMTSFAACTRVVLLGTARSTDESPE
jgi:hypothetical protein